MNNLMKSVLNGDEASFAELLARYKMPLYSFILSLVKDEGTADDVFQESFIRFFKNMKNYKEEGKFKQWIFMTAYNLSIDHIRKAKKETALTEAEAVIAPQNQTPHSLAETSAARAEILSAFGRISAEEKEVISLREYSGMSFKEISIALNCPIGTVLSRANRGLQKMKNILEKKDELQSVR